MRFVVFLLFILFSTGTYGQKNTAIISGRVIDENENPIAKATITVLGKTQGILSSDSGTFKIEVPSNTAIALVFTHQGFNEEQKNFYLSDGEEEKIMVKLFHGSKTLETVVISNDQWRNETGLIKINPKNTYTVPSATGGVEGLLKIIVGSNNELTSQYSVRGGNYDENLIYINDYEIYRPFLIRSGQQEGLSFINPELVKNIQFYNGGYQAKYGDKISSVLDIQYKSPDKFRGSAYVSLMEAGFHLEGISRNQKFSFIGGVRTKTNKNLLSTQETQGNYVPSASDVQLLLGYKFSEKTQIELLGIVSSSKFSLIPETAQKTTSVFSPAFTANVGLDIYFEGQEKDNYTNSLVGFSLIQNLNKKLKLKWMLSRYDDRENENFDILGTYLFGERNFDKSKADFGKITNPLAAGAFHNYARNELQMEIYHIGQKGNFDAGKHYLQWGLGVDFTKITDRLNEWERKDSAGYTLPFNPSTLSLSSVLKSQTNLNYQKFSGYVQDNIRLGKTNQNITLQVGVRFNYNSLNKELIVSPRAQMSFKPNWNKDVVFKLAAGIYDQPPFYREMRRYDGTVNTNLKSQKSLQFVAGIDYNFSRGNTPIRLTTEVYYKSLWDVVPYDIDNVRIRYFGENSATAYAVGFETRVYSELVKDAESWFSIGLSQTKEKLDNYFYYDYKNAAGEIITSKSTDQTIVDSVKHDVGYVRRPSDKLLTMGLFLQDYLSTNRNFRVHLSVIYGSNMSYNIPNNPKYRNGLIIEPYMRVDLGLSALLLSNKDQRRSHSPFRSFENIWASVEVFNLIDRANIISYQLIKDYANNTFSIPNRLTPRLINVKILARF